MSAITLTGIEKTYADAVALKATDLSIRAGEFMTLLGPSGSGKTTLLNIIAGVTAPTRGRVHFGDTDVTSMPTRERNLGMVFQNYALMPHMTVFDNVAFPLRVRGMARAEIGRRVMDTLALVAMQPFAQRKPRELSGGQQQRVSIARCLVYRPPIVLMDEPLGALDKKLRAQLQLEIKRLHREIGFTTLYVTHDQEEALSLSDRICLMHDGSVVQVASPAGIYFEPQSVLAADFIGESNLLDAIVVRAGSSTVVRALGDTAITTAASELAAGRRATVLLRPESLRILGSTEQATNIVPGHVRELLFFGDHVRVAIAAPGETVLTAKLPSTAGTPLPAPGDPVRLGWEPEHSMLLPERP